MLGSGSTPTYIDLADNFNTKILTTKHKQEVDITDSNTRVSPA